MEGTENGSHMRAKLVRVVGFPFETTRVSEGDENTGLTPQTPSTPVSSAQTVSSSIHSGEHGSRVSSDNSEP